MTTPEALNALADRVEREEPSYALDCMIEHLCEPERAKYIGNARPYTTSLDAAVTLVPPKCVVVAVWSDEGSMFQVCSMPLGAVEGQRWFQQCKAKTPALALCAAALRARALAGDETGSGR